MAYVKAVRKAVPILASLSGVSGSGKTYSALLMAAGIAGKTGRVGFLDTENGRGTMYADSPGIMKALPKGYEYARLDSPFTPKSYIEKIDEAEAAGINVLVIDSGSHEWEGVGGCSDIAENNKLKGMPNWANAKREHKQLVNRLLYTDMHILVCLRAREKIKIVKDATGKDQFINVGIQPIAEKNFVFEMLVSLQLDELSKQAAPIKVPEPLKVVFPGGQLITVESGEQLREWNQTGKMLDDGERLKQRARAIAEDGLAAYQQFFSALSAKDKKILVESTHAANKAAAEQADRSAIEQYDDFASAPDPLDVPANMVISINSKLYAPNEDRTAWTEKK